MAFFGPSDKGLTTLNRPVASISANRVVPVLGKRTIRATMASIAGSSTGRANSIYYSFSGGMVNALGSGASGKVCNRCSSGISLSGYDRCHITLPRRIRGKFYRVVAAISRGNPLICSTRVSQVCCANNRGGVVVGVASRHLLTGANNVIRKVDNAPVVRGNGLVNTVARIVISGPRGNCTIFTRAVLRSSGWGV